jgi:phosphate acetyltransferase
LKLFPIFANNEIAFFLFKDMSLLLKIIDRAQKNKNRIVLPEGNEERTLKAANWAIEKQIADIILIGNQNEIIKFAGTKGFTLIEKAQIVDPLDHPKKEAYIHLMLEMRKSKGLTYDQAKIQIEDPLYLGAVMIKAGDADGEVSGAINATSDVLRPAFQYIKTMPGVSVVSGAFVMLLKNPEFGDEGVMIFADCAVNPDPTEEQLAQIAIASAQTARSIAGLDPRVAMLSFSTKGSATHPEVDKVVKAMQLAKEAMPELQIEGELQADAAIVPEIGQRKAPGSKIAGRANVLVFPNLASGNIAYKLVQRMAQAEAIGPILQGMASPVNDLSRGCSAEDIFNLIAITVCQAQKN